MAIEETWYDGGLFSVEHSLGPVRPKLRDDMKLSYKLVDSVALEGGVVRQVYVKKGAEGKDDIGACKHHSNKRIYLHSYCIAIVIGIHLSFALPSPFLSLI